MQNQCTWEGRASPSLTLIVGACGTANGKGQCQHAEDSGKDPGPEQLEGHLQPNAHTVQTEAQDGRLLVNRSSMPNRAN